MSAGAERKGPADRKRLAQANTLRLCEHYAGEVRRTVRSEGGVRHHFGCPRCARQTFTAYLPEDADPPGNGTVGCSGEGCSVPERLNAPDLVAILEGYEGPSAYKRALGRAEAIVDSLAAAPTLMTFVPEAPRLPEPAPKQATAPDGGPNPTRPEQPSFEAPGLAPREAKTDGPRASFPVSRTPRDDRGEHPGGPQRSGAGPLGADGPEGQDFDAEVRRRDAVYRALLALCPPDEHLVAFFARERVGGGLVRRSGFGISYAARSGGILAELASRFGTPALCAVPGFSQRPGGALGFALSSGDWALVPYTDGAGRIVALEAFDLAGGTHRLLGGEREAGGRDPGLGGSDHVWYAGDPARIEAFTDDLLEAMRAEEAGVRCAALRAPGAHNPPTGEELLPELVGVSLGARKVLYVPSPNDRGRAAAPRAARATVGAAGGRPVVVSPPYEAGGLGAYLLSVGEGERALAFDGLFHPAIATELDPKSAPRRIRGRFRPLGTRAARRRGAETPPQVRGRGAKGARDAPRGAAPRRGGRARRAGRPARRRARLAPVSYGPDATGRIRPRPRGQSDDALFGARRGPRSLRPAGHHAWLTRQGIGPPHRAARVAYRVRRRPPLRRRQRIARGRGALRVGGVRRDPQGQVVAPQAGEDDAGRYQAQASPPRATHPLQGLQEGVGPCTFARCQPVEARPVPDGDPGKPGPRRSRSNARANAARRAGPSTRKKGASA